MMKKAPACVRRYSRAKSRKPRSMIVKLPGSGADEVKHVHLMHFAVGNMDKRRDVAAQVDLRVHLYGGFGGAKMRPREHLERQVDGRRVESVHGVIKINAEGIFRIEPPCFNDQGVREIAINAPVALLVGIGQIAACDVPANTEMIEFGLLRAQTDFDVAQALTKRQLRKRHAQVPVSYTHL